MLLLRLAAELKLAFLPDTDFEAMRFATALQPQTGLKIMLADRTRAAGEQEQALGLPWASCTPERGIVLLV